MLPLLRRSLIPAALLASAVAAHAQDAATTTSAWTWSFGVGQALESFHWHETSSDQWWRPVGTNENGRTVYDVVDRGQVLFLQEDGGRNNTFAKAWLEFVPGMRLVARFGYTYASVSYDGGLQPSLSASAATWPLDSTEMEGATYYQYRRIPYATSTGYFGPDLEVGFELRPRHRLGSFFPRAELAYCYSSLRRKVAYTTTRASGYDEVWTRDWVRLAGGPGWSTCNGELLLSFGLRQPLSTVEDVQKVSGGADISPVTLKPEARTAWETSLAWESRFGLDMKVRYSRQIFDESPSVGGSLQPDSYEGVTRFEVGWNF